jgi:hypothetical protein
MRSFVGGNPKQANKKRKDTENVKELKMKVEIRNEQELI